MKECTLGGSMKLDEARKVSRYGYRYGASLTRWKWKSPPLNGAERKFAFVVKYSGQVAQLIHQIPAAVFIFPAAPRNLALALARTPVRDPSIFKRDPECPARSQALYQTECCLLIIYVNSTFLPRLRHTLFIGGDFYRLRAKF